MATPQTAICADNGRFGIFLTLTLTGSGMDDVRRTAAALPGWVDDLADSLGEPGLKASLAFGAAAWEPVFGGPKPPLLVPFEPLGSGTRHMPATPADLFLHIHSPRHDANFVLARRVMRSFGAAVRVEEEIHGFRYLDSRDLTGFVDGTENPKGEERAGVALVGGEDPASAGGSYVTMQRFVHALDRWEAQPVAEQEACIGRTKQDDEEMDDDVKPPTAHIARVVIEEDGEELEILRQSMPYGTTSESGLCFVAYCSTPATFRKMAENMVKPDGDRLLDFTRAVTGASFFAPSVEMLRRLG